MNILEGIYVYFLSLFVLLKNALSWRMIIAHELVLCATADDVHWIVFTYNATVDDAQKLPCNLFFFAKRGTYFFFSGTGRKTAKSLNNHKLS